MLAAMLRRLPVEMHLRRDYERLKLLVAERRKRDYAHLRLPSEERLRQKALEGWIVGGEEEGQSLKVDLSESGLMMKTLKVLDLLGLERKGSDTCRGEMDETNDEMLWEKEREMLGNSSQTSENQGNMSSIRPRLSQIRS